MTSNPAYFMTRSYMALSLRVGEARETAPFI